MTLHTSKVNTITKAMFLKPQVTVRFTRSEPKCLSNGVEHKRKNIRVLNVVKENVL